jgi:WD40 repeat protein
MSPRTILGSVVVLALAAAAAWPQQASQPRLDSLGDALPPGAVARLGTVRFKHTPPQVVPLELARVISRNASLTTAIFSADGTRIATLSRTSSNVHLWDVATGKEIPGPWNSPKATFYPYSIAFSPDGSILAGNGIRFDNSGLETSRLLLWDIAQAKVVRNFADELRTSNQQSLAFADGGKILVSDDQSGNVFWWDVATGQQLRAWQAPAFKKNEVGANNEVQVINQGNAILGPSTLAVYNTRFEGDNQVGFRQTSVQVTVYGLHIAKEPGRVVHFANLRPGSRAQAFSADGKRFALANKSGLIELRD